MKKHTLLTILLLCAGLLAGCAKKTEEKKPSGPAAAIVTVTQAQARDVRITERAVGDADSATAPKVGAEVAGRIVKIRAEIGDWVKKGQVLAEIDATDYASDAKKQEAQALTQQRLTERYRDLAAKGFISPTQLESTEAQNVAAHEQDVRAAKNLVRTRIVSPVSGRVDQRLVSEGDWIELGKPVFQVATSEALRVRLPFPENVAFRIKPGQKVLLTTPTASSKTVEGKIAQLRPQVGGASRSFDAIVEVKNPGDWKPGASVDGEVVVETHANAVTVPEISVVLRPAGTVVYVVAEGKAQQRIVKTGSKNNGQVEITEGIAAGETVALDGAGFLTDKAAVAVKK
jgi:RND family efflux transporter MFP subunit